MGFLYVNENGATIGVEANQCTVNYKAFTNDNSVCGRMYEQRDSGKLFFEGREIFWPVDFNRTC